MVKELRGETQLTRIRPLSFMGARRGESSKGSWKKVTAEMARMVE